jgi:hypothetical protein
VLSEVSDNIDSDVSAREFVLRSICVAFWQKGELERLVRLTQENFVHVSTVLRYSTGSKPQVVLDYINGITPIMKDEGSVPFVLNFLAPRFLLEMMRCLSLKDHTECE